MFCCAEAYWNPAREPDAVLADYGRLVFGERVGRGSGRCWKSSKWFPTGATTRRFRTRRSGWKRSMSRLLPCWARSGGRAARLPLAPTHGRVPREPGVLRRAVPATGCRRHRQWTRSAALARAAGQVPREPPGARFAGRVGESAGRAARFSAAGAAAGGGRANCAELDVAVADQKLLGHGVRDLRRDPPPDRPAGPGRDVGTLFRRFRCEYAVVHAALRAGKDAARQPASRSCWSTWACRFASAGWKLSGWTLQGEDAGRDVAGQFRRAGDHRPRRFRRTGYRWLVVRLTEGPAGRPQDDRGQRPAWSASSSAPARRSTEKKEWWVTRSYPDPRWTAEERPTGNPLHRSRHRHQRSRSGCGTPGDTR